MISTDPRKQKVQRAKIACGNDDRALESTCRLSNPASSPGVENSLSGVFRGLSHHVD